ncbi:hypothetical protein BDN67DRAFT_985857 [Paxillus ammoniavirescens]|nr:hypothetical protein BDN67DRAFT_985857 [Paxillus ammoniavirescens]
MNASYSGQEAEVTVNQRNLVEKVLARYPEEFTVFRELVQNADDAGARNVQIEFNTKDYTRPIPHSGDSDKSTSSRKIDLNGVKVSKWVVSNDGDKLKQEDWDRLANIGDWPRRIGVIGLIILSAVGNPDEQKIGAFGVGFFSVFSVTERPVISSGDRCMKMFYNKDKLMVQHGKCTDTNWTMIEMEAEDGRTAMPKPFDLSRFLCTAVTFLAKLEKITILFNGQRLSKITKSRGERVVIKDLPKDLETKRDAGFMHVQSVDRIPQQVRVDLTELAYSAGSKRPLVNKTVPNEQDANPAKRPSFFEGLLNLKKPESQRAAPVSPNLLHTNTSVVNYTIYSAHISSTPSEDIISGLERATKKKPPTSFLFEAVHFSMDEHQRVMQDRNEEGSIGSVFRGVQALCGEEGE